MDALLMVLVLASVLASSKSQTCTHYSSYPSHLSVAGCHNLALTFVPNNLQTGIEVLDISKNRIRELHRDSLSRYKSLREIYLGDNMITVIEEGAFSNLHNLETLDLSMNGLYKIPTEIFQLPALKTLYINENPLNLVSFEEEYKDISSSLTFTQLDISRCRLMKFPNAPFLQHITHLNISHNNISLIKVSDLAPLCSLQQLDISHNLRLYKQEYSDSCYCILFSLWLQEHKIKLLPEVKINCPKAIEEAVVAGCKNSSSYSEALELREKCTKYVNLKERQVQVKVTWKWVGIGLGIGLGFIVIVSLYIWCCRIPDKKSTRSNNNDTSNIKKREAKKLMLGDDV